MNPIYDWPILPTFFSVLPSEARIEISVEKAVDRADALLMAGKVTQADYDIRMSQINQWADMLYLSLQRRAARTR